MIWYRGLCSSNKGESSFLNSNNYCLKIWVWNQGGNAKYLRNQDGETKNQGGIKQKKSHIKTMEIINSKSREKST